MTTKQTRNLAIAAARAAGEKRADVAARYGLTERQVTRISPTRRNRRRAPGASR